MSTTIPTGQDYSAPASFLSSISSSQMFAFSSRSKDLAKYPKNYNGGELKEENLAEKGKFPRIPNFSNIDKEKYADAVEGKTVHV